MSKKWQKIKACLTASLIPQMASAATVDGFLNSTGRTLSITIGIPVFVIGVIIVGYSLIMGKEDAVKKGAYVLGGGGVILLADPIVKLIRTLAGV